MRNGLTPTALLLALLVAACGQPAASPSAAVPSSPGSPTPDASGFADGSPSAGTPSPEPAATATPEPADEPPSWTRLEAGGPMAREDHTWTVSGDGATAYLFGGRDGETVHGDLWAYDLASDSWAGPLSPGGPTPDPRFGHEAEWVDGIGLVIVFGQRGATFYDDLWAYDPAADAWRQLPASGATPVARYGSCASLGPDGRLWISHGFTAESARFADTWAYDFGAGTWTDETPSAGTPPVSRCLHGCWWTDAGTFRLYAGQTTGATALGDLWELDPAVGAWRPLEGTLPVDRNLYARARVGSATIAFGGQAIDESYLGDVHRLADEDTGANEVEITGEASPPGRSGAELIHDPARSRLLLFGGRNGDGAMADLWALGEVSAGE